MNDILVRLQRRPDTVRCEVEYLADPELRLYCKMKDRECQPVFHRPGGFLMEISAQFGKIIIGDGMTGSP